MIKWTSFKISFGVSLFVHGAALAFVSVGVRQTNFSLVGARDGATLEIILVESEYLDKPASQSEVATDKPRATSVAPESNHGPVGEESTRCDTVHSSEIMDPDEYFSSHRANQTNQNPLECNVLETRREQLTEQVVLKDPAGHKVAEKVAGRKRIQSPAGYLQPPKVNYPKEARWRKQQGRVLLAVSVSESGFPTSVRVKESSGFPLLDDAATSAMRKWRFVSARINETSVASDLEVPIEFILTD